MKIFGKKVKLNIQVHNFKTMLNIAAAAAASFQGR